MRIAFAGTPEFAATALAALIGASSSARFEVPLVLSQPDRPSGRGMKMMPSAVKELALAHGIAVSTPTTLRRGDEAATALHLLREVAPDVLVVAAYGLILPQQVLDIPRGAGAGFKAINIHASLLPRWRGAAPIARAIEAGDSTTGITLMQMDAGLDTGPMLSAESMAIADHDTAASLGKRLSALGAEMIVRALRAPDELRAAAQPELGATYANKLDKREAWLDFSQSAGVLQRKLHAFDPFPVAAAKLRGVPIKFWRGEVVDATGVPGTVLSVNADGVVIACGISALTVTVMQKPGGKHLSAREFLAGFPIAPGEVFESVPRSARA